MEILKKNGVDWRDRRIISRLYMHQEAVVRVATSYIGLSKGPGYEVADGEAEPATIGRGVRQGCLLLPFANTVFDLCGDDDDRSNGWY